MLDAVYLEVSKFFNLRKAFAHKACEGVRVSV